MEVSGFGWGDEVETPIRWGGGGGVVFHTSNGCIAATCRACVVDVTLRRSKLVPRALRFEPVVMMSPPELIHTVRHTNT